jgi:ribose-phosphate pyrophosphokinase
MYILGGTASVIISEELSKILRAPLAKTISKRFPDEEFYFRILDDIKNKAVVIVQTTYPDPNLVELFLMQNAAEEAGAKKITVVIPYFGYARQDTKFQEGEAVSAKALARLISLNADEVITIDPHKEHILDFFSTKAKSGTAVPEIASYLKEKNIDMVLAPDKGAKNRAKRAAEIINCDFDYMQKTRIDGSTVEMKPKQLDAKNKTVAIIDDIISTGGTMALAIKELKGQGAKKVFVACTHGLFASDAIKKLSSAGCDEIISTDTIQNEYSTVHTASCIAKVIKGK